MGRAEVSFADHRCCCSMCRRPLLVARDFGRCFVMRAGVRSGQVLKWPHSTVHKKVEGRGLYMQPSM